MDIQAGSGHRAEHPRFAQLPALPALPGTGLGTGTAPGHCSIQARGAWVPLQLRLPWPLVLALLCWIPGNLEISAWIGTLCGGSACQSPPACISTGGSRDTSPTGCHSRSTSSMHRACRVTRPSQPSPGFVTCATLWGHSGDSPDTRLAPSPDLAVLTQQQVKCPFSSPAEPESSTACGAPGSERLLPAATGNREMWDKEGTPGL